MDGIAFCFQYRTDKTSVAVVAADSATVWAVESSNGDWVLCAKLVMYLPGLVSFRSELLKPQAMSTNDQTDCAGGGCFGEDGVRCKTEYTVRQCRVYEYLTSARFTLQAGERDRRAEDQAASQNLTESWGARRTS